MSQTDHYQLTKAWRKRHPQKRYAYTAWYYTRHRETAENRKNSRRIWTANEIKLISARIRPPDTVLARQLGRSVQAIQCKRSKTKEET